MESKLEAKRPTVVVVEDDASISELLELYLGREGFSVVTTAAAGDAEALVKAHDPVLVVLDLMLPDGSGLQVLRRVRTFSEVPVIVLTARDTDQDKILGLELGADDYMTKPFNPGELLARMRAVLRRSSPPEETSTLTLGGVEVLPEERIVRIDGARTDLTPREFDLLQYLLLNRGIALSRDRLLEEVWGYSFYGDARTVDVHVRQIRKKLGRWSPIVQTVWGLGYRIDPEAEALAEEELE
ncbi:MAG: response regulator transcription factor [Actinobacteria bacterium]|nr:response regulator transcription factor [Actinomycetota bacterium]